MSNSEFDREINRLVNLVQNKDKSVEELEPIARVNLAVREFKRNPLFDDPNEQKLAEDQYRAYLEKNEIESASDLHTLRSLIYLEVLEQRIQKELNTQASKNKIPYDKTLKSLTDLQNQMLSLKIKLGIDKKEQEKDQLSELQLLDKRVIEHINANKGDYTLGLGFKCENCQHKNYEHFLIFHYMKDKKFIKHPWATGRFLFNYEILSDVKNKKLSKEDAYRYLMCAGEGTMYQPDAEDHKYCVDYIDWCLENWTELTDLMNKV